MLGSQKWKLPNCTCGSERASRLYIFYILRCKGTVIQSPNQENTSITSACTSCTSPAQVKYKFCTSEGEKKDVPDRQTHPLFALANLSEKACKYQFFITISRSSGVRPLSCFKAQRYSIATMLLKRFQGQFAL